MKTFSLELNYVIYKWGSVYYMYLDKKLSLIWFIQHDICTLKVPFFQPRLMMMDSDVFTLYLVYPVFLYGNQILFVVN